MSMAVLLLLLFRWREQPTSNFWGIWKGTISLEYLYLGYSETNNFIGKSVSRFTIINYIFVFPEYVQCRNMAIIKFLSFMLTALGELFLCGIIDVVTVFGGLKCLSFCP